MTIYAVVDLNGEAIEAPGSRLAIFDGNEVAGVAEITTGPFGQLYQLTAWSDQESVSGMTLQVYDAATGEIHDLSDTVDFGINHLIGAIDVPFVFEVSFGDSGRAPSGPEMVSLVTGPYRSVEVIDRQRTRFLTATSPDDLHAEGAFTSTLGSRRPIAGTWAYERTGSDTGSLVLVYAIGGTDYREVYEFAFASFYRVEGTVEVYENGSLIESDTYTRVFEGRPTRFSDSLGDTTRVGEPVSMTVLTPEMNPDAEVLVVRRLPPGLTFDRESGTINGHARVPGTYELRILVRNADGSREWLTSPLEVNALPDSAVGNFMAVVARDEELNGGLGGWLNARVARNGLCSGLLRLGARNYRFRGWVSVDEEAEEIRMATQINRPGQAPLSVEWVFGDDDTLLGLVADVDGTANFDGWRQVWHPRVNPVPDSLQGYYTAVTMLDAAQGLEGDPGVPQGNGFAGVRATGAGVVRWTGRLPDGAPLSFGGILGPNAEYFVSFPLYAGTGSLLGRGVIISDVTGPLLDSDDWDWMKQSQANLRQRNYPAGFGSSSDPVKLSILGDRYQAPAPREMQPGFDNGTDNAILSFGQGGLDEAFIDPGIIFDLLWTGRGVVPQPGNVENPARTQVSVNRRTGLIRGAFLLVDPHPSNGGTIRRRGGFRGMLLQNRAQGAGFFLLNQLPDANANPPTTLQTAPILSGQMGLEPMVAP